MISIDYETLDISFNKLELPPLVRRDGDFEETAKADDLTFPDPSRPCNDTVFA